MMTATIILGLIIAAAFGYGLNKIYRAFFKSEAACCSEGNCSGCEGSCSTKKAIDEGYRVRVAKIEKFPIHRTIDVDGMTCEKCIYKVVRALEKVDGVTIAAASLEKQAAQVGLKEDISDDVLREAIKKAGYKAGTVTA
ncbi:MAG: FeoB-associated Cys-rich membrane protein [Selenomonadaceae bacterium]|nr:FeoB-associated Cys-rich membrane protein [Selenomonadaceae bacterium]